MKIKKILFITVARSDFYLQKILINEIKKEKNFKIKLIVTGNHHLNEFGETVKDIYKEKYSFIEEIKIKKSINIKKNKTFLFSYLCNEFEKKILNIQPDVIILFGDRYETLSAGIASMFLNIPIVHIHGGEITHGSIDDYIRHSISKISHIHFVASEKYKDNVIQLGENPKNVFNVGSLSADRIKKMKKINKKGLEKLINFNLDKDYFMVCIHPVTIYKNKTIIIIDELFKSLDYFENYKLIITYPGFDTSYDYIVKKIKNYQKKNSERVLIKKNLGDDLYLNLLRNSKLIIGNSSSGIIDSPYLKVPTINIGDRQEGRLMSNSIINCEAKKNKIIKSIKLVLSRNFNLKLKKINIYYGRGGTAMKIIKKLKKINLQNILIKKFFFFKR